MAGSYNVLLVVFSHLFLICYTNNTNDTDNSTSIIDLYSSYIDVDPSFTESLLLPTVSSLLVVTSLPSSESIMSSSIGISEPVFTSPPVPMISPSLTVSLIPLQSS